MPIRRRMRSMRLASRMMVAGIAVLALATPTTPASAEGLFDFLFGGFRRSAPPPPPPQASPYADPYPQFSPFSRRDSIPRVESGPSVSYCVRLCDGHYFPIQRHAGANPAQLCNSFCPASRTKIFNGGNINYAVASDGTRYADTANAYAYRDKVVPGCTCNGKDAFGVVTLNATNDPTLRPGDIVVTNNGMMAYRGGKNRNVEFTPIESYSGLSSDLRRKLADTKIAPTGTSSATQSQSMNVDSQTAGDDKQVQLER